MSAAQTSDPSTPRINPWPWQHRKKTTVALIRSPNHQCWIRVTHHTGVQKLVPWPVFKGWDTALPEACGTPDHALQGYSVPDMVPALAALRKLGFSSPLVTRWPEILKLLPPR